MSRYLLLFLELSGNIPSVRENRLVKGAERVFFEDRFSVCVCSDRAAAVTHRKKLTFDTPLLYRNAGPGNEFLTGGTIFQQLGEALAFKNIPEEILWIAGNPAVALCNEAA